MRCAGDSAHGLRARALIVALWRAGLRISEALALAERDLDVARGSILIRRGKGGKRREVGMDTWAWQHLNAWLNVRVSMRIGALLCVIAGWTLVRQRGSHEVRAHPDRDSRIVVAGKDSDTVPVGTPRSIRRASGLEHLR